MVFGMELVNPLISSSTRCHLPIPKEAPHSLMSLSPRACQSEDMCQQKKNKNSNQAQRSGDFMRQKWRIYGLSDNATDAYSDIDFGLITTDEAYDDFFPSREALIRLLGEPIFLEVFSDYG